MPNEATARWPFSLIKQTKDQMGQVSLMRKHHVHRRAIQWVKSFYASSCAGDSGSVFPPGGHEIRYLRGTKPPRRWFFRRAKRTGDAHEVRFGCFGWRPPAWRDRSVGMNRTHSVVSKSQDKNRFASAYLRYHLSVA